MFADYRDATAMAVKRFAADGIVATDVLAVAFETHGKWALRATWLGGDGEQRNAFLESGGHFRSWKQFADKVLRVMAEAELLRAAPEHVRLAAYAAADAEYEAARAEAMRA